MIANKALSRFKALASAPSILVSHFSSSSSQFHPPQKRRPQAEDESTVAVWWDVETCPVPEGVNPAGVAEAITSAVRANAMKGPVEILAVADIFKLPKPTWKLLHNSGISINHVPSGPFSPFGAFLCHLMNWVIDMPLSYTLFVITDREFSLVRRLREKKYNLLVATNNVSSDDLCDHTSIVWRWNDLVKREDLTGKCSNQSTQGLFMVAEPSQPNSSRIDTSNEAENFTIPEKKISNHEKEDETEDCLEIPNDKLGWEAELPGRKHISQVIIGSLYLKANRSIHQVIEVVTEVEKYNRLVRLREEVMDGSQILIFTETKRCCDQITKQLRMDCSLASSIREGENQAERNPVISKFKSGTSPVIEGENQAERNPVIFKFKSGENQPERNPIIFEFKSGTSSVIAATDVSSLGLDVENIKLVINYDCPTSFEDYINRVGCAADNGTVHTFFTDADFANANEEFARQLFMIFPGLSDLAKSFGGGSVNTL